MSWGSMVKRLYVLGGTLILVISRGVQLYYGIAQCVCDQMKIMLLMRLSLLRETPPSPPPGAKSGI